jgi:nucleotide-binding universal stress UspA family protein
LRAAADLAASDDGRLVVLHVLSPFYSGPAFPSEEEIAWVPPKELIARLQARLEALVAHVLGPRATDVECRVVRGDPLRRILSAARDADVIVMATSGRTGLAHVLIGSVAEKVVRHAPVPVLTIRADRGARRRGPKARLRGRRAARRRR